MKLKGPLAAKIGGFVAATTARFWMNTIDYQVACFDPTVDPVHPDFHGTKIYVFWHEYILFPITFRGNCDLVMLLSRHRDADMLSRAARHLGYGFVRGSTSRGGAAALKQMAALGRTKNITITPDGPRGPRRRLAQGPVFLASRLGLPLVAMGFGFDRPWRLGSWDRFVIPRPYSRGRAVIGPPMHLPADLDRDGVEHYRREVERLLNRLTLEAEAWAEAGTRKLSQQPGRRGNSGRRRSAVDVDRPPSLCRGVMPRQSGNAPARRAG